MLRVKLIGSCQGIFRIARFSGFLLLLSIIPIYSLWSVAHYTSEPTLRLARDELTQRDRQEWMDLAAVGFTIAYEATSGVLPGKCVMIKEL
ncbi:hypothetical protein E4U12_001576 [Claviceps purpurea]|nr:hypothetical protein E4U12_001576 [Claviceps purpurea]